MISMTGVNQELIAQQLNIARTTVSRCFTNHPGINPDTRAKVFALAAQLGYHYMEPKVRNHEPAERQSRIAVIVCSDVEEFNRPDYESPGIELIPGVSEFAQLNKQQMDLHFVSPKETSLSEPSYRKLFALRKRRWQGLILIYPFPEAVLDDLSTKYPCVSLVEQYSHTSLDCVDVDHHKGITTLMQKLLALGHRRIGFLTRGYAVEPLWSFRRQSSWFEILMRNGMPYVEGDVIVINRVDTRNEKQDYDEVAKRTRQGVTAWVCAADHQAYDLIHELKKRGLEVPKDVSVTGFDGIRRPPGFPTLSTMRIPYREIGLTGGKRLLDLISKRFYSAQHILLECRMEPGETIAAPAQRKSK